MINTPSQAYTWIPVIKQLCGRGHDVNVIAREYGSAVELLRSKGIACSSFKPVTKN